LPGHFEGVEAATAATKKLHAKKAYLLTMLASPCLGHETATVSLC
jgi:hypothetical protein